MRFPFPIEATIFKSNVQNARVDATNQFKITVDVFLTLNDVVTSTVEWYHIRVGLAGGWTN